MITIVSWAAAKPPFSMVTGATATLESSSSTETARLAVRHWLFGAPGANDSGVAAELSDGDAEGDESEGGEEDSGPVFTVMQPARSSTAREGSTKEYLL